MYGRGFYWRGFFGWQRTFAAFPGGVTNFALQPFLSLFHFPEKERKVPWRPRQRLVRSWDNYSHFRSLVLFSCWFLGL
jgi:hypothetical protein